MRVVALCGLIFTAVLGFAQEAASGWTAPKLTGEASLWRDSDPNRYLEVHADFDGDGREDRAALLVNLGSKQLGLFVWLSGRKRPIRIETDTTDDMNRLGITRIEPGEYKTACGKGYWECKRGEPEVVRLARPAVSYFLEGSAEVFFYWNSQRRRFARIQISD